MCRIQHTYLPTYSDSVLQIHAIVIFYVKILNVSFSKLKGLTIIEFVFIILIIIM